MDTNTALGYADMAMSGQGTTPDLERAWDVLQYDWSEETDTDRSDELMHAMTMITDCLGARHGYDLG